MQPTTYTCTVCGAPATVAAGEVRRTCGHAPAPVVASLHAVARGRSTIAAPEKKAA